MFALLVLATGRSIHFDFGYSSSQNEHITGAWSLPSTMAPDARFEALMDAVSKPANLAYAVDLFSRQYEHQLPSLGPLPEWKADVLRATVSAAFIERHLAGGPPWVEMFTEALLANDHDALVAQLLPSSRWQLLRGFWLCSAAQLEAAAFTPRNSDETRNRARALLGIDNHRTAAADGVPFIGDEELSEVVRIRLIEAMGCSKTAEATSPLLTAMATGSDAIADAAIVALGKIGASAALPPLLSALQQSTGHKQARVIQALRRFSPHEGAAYLLGFLETHATPLLQQAIFVHSDGSCLPDIPTPHLVHVLDSPDQAAWKDAMVLLSIFGAAEDAPSLRRIAGQQQDPELRSIALMGAESLSRCGRPEPLRLAPLETV